MYIVQLSFYECKNASFLSFVAVRGQNKTPTRGASRFPYLSCPQSLLELEVVLLCRLARRAKALLSAPRIGD